MYRLYCPKEGEKRNNTRNTLPQGTGTIRASGQGPTPAPPHLAPLLVPPASSSAPSPSYFATFATAIATVIYWSIWAFRFTQKPRCTGRTRSARALFSRWGAAASSPPTPSACASWSWHRRGHHRSFRPPGRPRPWRLPRQLNVDFRDIGGHDPFPPRRPLPPPSIAKYILFTQLQLFCLYFCPLRMYFTPVSPLSFFTFFLVLHMF
jgi:hypothetical protein